MSYITLAETPTWKYVIYDLKSVIAIAWSSELRHKLIELVWRETFVTFSELKPFSLTIDQVSSLAWLVRIIPSGSLSK